MASSICINAKNKVVLSIFSSSDILKVRTLSIGLEADLPHIFWSVFLSFQLIFIHFAP